MADEQHELSPELAARIQFDVPHSARIWNYWMGGKDNYEVDRWPRNGLRPFRPAGLW